MRSVVSIVLGFFVTVILSGCGRHDSTTETSTGNGAHHDRESSSSNSAEGATEEVDVPTVFGVDAELQREIRVLLTQYIEQRQFPGDPEENLAKAFDSAMETIRRPANEFGIQPDADGNLVWPEESEDQLNSLRAQFDAQALFDAHEIALPDWAKPLLDEYEANSISTARKELLFCLASCAVMLNMA